MNHTNAFASEALFLFKALTQFEQHLILNEEKTWSAKWIASILTELSGLLPFQSADWLLFDPKKQGYLWVYSGYTQTDEIIEDDLLPLQNHFLKQAHWENRAIDITQLLPLPMRPNYAQAEALAGVFLYDDSGKPFACLLLNLQTTWSETHLFIWTHCATLLQRIGKLHWRNQEAQKKILQLQAANQALEQSQQALYENSIDFVRLHEQLTDSLNYAKRMQQIILPSEVLLNSIFDEHFVIYQPKNYVSGDFYWCSQLDYTYLAVADCTGHGVPGAFMSMIGNTLLNEIINIKRINNPSLILKQLNKGINKVLKQEESNNIDGMDIGICRFERNEQLKMQLVFAGAKFNLLLYTNSSWHLVKGNRVAIGGKQSFQEVSEFDNYTFTLSDGDTLYLSTDGFFDTPNEHRKSYSFKRFRAKVEEIIHLNLMEQKQLLIQDLSQHLGKATQRDDVTVFAVRV